MFVLLVSWDGICIQLFVCVGVFVFDLQGMLCVGYYGLVVVFVWLGDVVVVVDVVDFGLWWILQQQICCCFLQVLSNVLVFVVLEVGIIWQVFGVWWLDEFLVDVLVIWIGYDGMDWVWELEIVIVVLVCSG